MKALYNKYGYFIKMDYTYKLIREQLFTFDLNNERRKSKFVVGFISGINSFNRIVIYGLCICLQENVDNTKIVLERFFRFMGSTCDAIITDQGKAFIVSIE
jgi:hypothetical protein